MLVVAGAVGGCILVVSAHRRLRRVSLARRTVPYLGALGPRRSLLLGGAHAATGVRAVAQPTLDALGAVLARVVGDERDLSERLEAAGGDLDGSAFRAEQVLWGLVGFAIGLGCGLPLGLLGRAPSPGTVLVLALVFGSIGIVARDRRLSRAVEARRARARAELPTVLDMVCIAATAGESLRGALDLVAADGSGPVAVELRAALRMARGGRSLGEALHDRARRLGLPAFDRFVDAVTLAHERGVPLGDALRSMAFDERERDKREVIEAAGRKQVSMLVPVVVLILPVAIVFAFYPGIVAIRTLAG